MEKQNLNIMLLSEMIFFLDIYKTAFQLLEKTLVNYSYTFIELSSMDAAWDYLKDTESSVNLYAVYIQLRVPVGSAVLKDSGNNVGHLIRSRFPEAKIIVGTTFSYNYNFWNLFKEIDPDGLISEDHIKQVNLAAEISEALSNPPYYSKIFLQAIRKHLNAPIVLDDVNMKLLYELSKGTRMADMPNIFPYSMSTLEKRKKDLKKLFNVTEKDDRVLLSKARESGAI